MPKFVVHGRHPTTASVHPAGYFLLAHLACAPITITCTGIAGPRVTASSVTSFTVGRRCRTRKKPAGTTTSGSWPYPLRTERKVERMGAHGSELASEFVKSDRKRSKRECLCWCHAGNFAACMCKKAGGCGSPGLVRTEHAAHAIIYDGAGRAVATIDPVTRKRVAIPAG